MEKQTRLRKQKNRLLPIAHDDDDTIDEFNVSSTNIVLRLQKDMTSNLQQTINDHTTLPDDTNNMTIINSIEIQLYPGATYTGNLHLQHDNMCFTTNGSPPATISGSIFINDVVGARFINIHVHHPKNRIAMRITNPLANGSDPSLVTECKLKRCSIKGAVVVTNAGAHVQLSGTRITDARGLPGLLVENGGAVVLRNICAIQRCKLPILTVSRVLKAVSTVHMFTNHLHLLDNQGPMLEDEGGMIVYYISILEGLLFDNDHVNVKIQGAVQGVFDLPKMYAVINQMCQARAVFPRLEQGLEIERNDGLATKKCWSREKYVRNIQNLKQQMQSQWTRELGIAFGRVLYRIDLLLGLK